MGIIDRSKRGKNGQYGVPGGIRMITTLRNFFGRVKSLLSGITTGQVGSPTVSVPKPMQELAPDTVPDLDPAIPVPDIPVDPPAQVSLTGSTVALEMVQEVPVLVPALDPAIPVPDIPVEPPAQVSLTRSAGSLETVQGVPAPVPATDIETGTGTEPAAVTPVSDAWTVRTYLDTVFVKIGRVYVESGDLVIRSDQDSRGFLLPEEEIELAFAGREGTVSLLDLTATVGTAHLSTSGRALNIVIDQQLHTVPLRSLLPVLNGNHHKAPLFVPKEDVAPDALPV